MLKSRLSLYNAVISHGAQQLVLCIEGNCDAQFGLQVIGQTTAWGDFWFHPRRLWLHSRQQKAPMPYNDAANDERSYFDSTLLFFTSISFMRYVPANHTEFLFSKTRVCALKKIILALIEIEGRLQQKQILKEADNNMLGLRKEIDCSLDQ